MGLTKWLARKGNVGGTARWAARMYLKVKKVSPEDPLKDKVLVVIGIRYMDTPLFRNKEFGTHVYSLTQDPGPLSGVAGLVVAILMAEAGFTDNTESNKRMFFDIITEELREFGLSNFEIFGE
jgi:hypothetical protein